MNNKLDELKQIEHAMYDIMLNYDIDHDNIIINKDSYYTLIDLREKLERILYN